MVAKAGKRGLQGDAAARIGRRPAAASTTEESASAGSTPAPVGLLDRLAAAVEEPPAAGERILEADVARIAPHPDNVRDSVGDVTGIGASIAERGVLQPLVVVTAAAFRAARPDVDLDPDIGWVILAGHRRHAGAVVAGVATVPVVVRDALAGDDDAVVSMLVENLQREDLTPMEQARAFGRLRGRGWSERKIATETGVSPGQVHKRLALLRLPPKLTEALNAGELVVADALRLLELPDDQLTEAWVQARKEEWRGVRGVVEARLAAMRAAEQAEQLRAALTAAGVGLVDDPETNFGSEWWHHQLHGDYAVPGVELPHTRPDSVARPDDALAHVAARGGSVRVSWFAKQPPGARSGSASPTTAPAASVGSTADDAERARARAEEQARIQSARDAAVARQAACARLVAGQLDPELAVEILADALLVDHTVEPYEAAGLAAEWCGADLDALAARDDIDDPLTTWMDEQAGAGRLPARRAAVAVALAEIEGALGWNAHAWNNAARTWTVRECRHVRRLAAHAGYDLTPDDEQRLATQDAASAGSTPHAEETR